MNVRAQGTGVSKSTLIFLLTTALLGACSTPPAGRTADDALKAEGFTPTFRDCYGESKVPWLISMAAGQKATLAELEAAAHELIGDQPGKLQVAKLHLSDWRQGRYRDAEEMAGEVFNACMRGQGLHAKHPERASSCFKEQWLAFMALHAKYEDKLPLDVATQRMLESNADDPALVAATRRVYKDIYTLTKTVNDPGIMDAQFHVCMNIYRYAN